MNIVNLPVINIEQIKAKDYAAFSIDVDGFWSNPITIYAEVFNEIWKVEVRHSSGGYDKGDQLQAELNFANALIVCINFAKNIENQLNQK
jgi:hypothetical protein